MLSFWLCLFNAGSLAWGCVCYFLGLCLLLCGGCVCYCGGCVYYCVGVVFVIVIFVWLFKFNNLVWDEFGEV